MAELKPGPLEALPPEPTELAGLAGELEVATGGAELAGGGLWCSADFSPGSLAAGAGAGAGPGPGPGPGDGAGAGAGAGATEEETGAGAADDETGGGGGEACKAGDGAAVGAKASEFGGVDEGAGIWVDANTFL